MDIFIIAWMLTAMLLMTIGVFIPAQDGKYPYHKLCFWSGYAIGWIGFIFTVILNRRLL